MKDYAQREAASGRQTAQNLRMLVVAWHWPPARQASARVLGNLFWAAPPECFRVVTRTLPRRAHGPPPIAGGGYADRTLDQHVPALRVHWPVDDGAALGVSGLPAFARAVGAMVGAACRVSTRWGAQQVMAVYPHRLSLLVGWRVASRMQLPLVLYMHDLLTEALPFRAWWRRAWWRAVDRRCIRDASLVITPTEDFALRFRRRGARRCFVLPHCVPKAPVALPLPQRRRDDGLRLVYAGAIYDPHEDAARAFIAATRDMRELRVDYCTSPDACGGLLSTVGARWVQPDEAEHRIVEADVALLFLGFNTAWPDEVNGCFPSKIVHYARLGKPMLAVVPQGCFVDRLIRQHGCGISVNRPDHESIHRAVARLRDRSTRRRMSSAALAMASRWHSEFWMPRLVAEMRAVAARPAAAKATVPAPARLPLSPRRPSPPPARPADKAGVS